MGHWQRLRQGHRRKMNSPQLPERTILTGHYCSGCGSQMMPTEPEERQGRRWCWRCEEGFAEAERMLEAVREAGGAL